MNKHLYLDAKRILAIVKQEGTVSFHNEAGFEVKERVDIMTQDATVMMLKEMGYREVPSL